MGAGCAASLLLVLAQAAGPVTSSLTAVGARRLPRAAPVGTKGPAAPPTPKGLERCSKPLAPPRSVVRRAGETVRYHVDIDGISVGTVDFKIERNGTLHGQAATEYRSLFKLDSLVSAFVAVEGRAAAIIPSTAVTPSQAMNKYNLDDHAFEEELRFSPEGQALTSRRTKNGEPKEEARVFPSPAPDFVSSFYQLRGLPTQIDGCTLLYGNQRAYTVWIRFDGEETVATPVGLQPADRYLIRYGSEKMKEPATARLWMSRGADRLPYRAEIDAPQHRMTARIHLFEPGS